MAIKFLNPTQLKARSRKTLVDQLNELQIGIANEAVEDSGLLKIKGGNFIAYIDNFRKFSEDGRGKKADEIGLPVLFIKNGISDVIPLEDIDALCEWLQGHKANAQQAIHALARGELNAGELNTEEVKS